MSADVVVLNTQFQNEHSRFFLAASRSALETESLCFAASYVPMESARLVDLEYKVKSKLNFIISRMKSHSLSAYTAAKQRSSRLFLSPLGFL